MISFFAILKDSYREARSGWVLQTMLILSTLVLLFIASISFRPTTVKNELDTGFGLMSRLLGSNPKFSSLDISVEDYSESNEREPWNSDYAFDLVVKTGTPELMGNVKEMKELPGNRYRAERMMKQSLGFLTNIKVENKPASSPNELRYRVTTKGTNTPDQLSWRHVPRVFFFLDAPIFTMSLRGGVFQMENYLIGTFGAWCILFISVVITAGFIPQMLQKGAVDLLISKPISRSSLLIYKYIGGLTYMVLLSTYMIGGTWFIIGLRNGIWSPRILLIIPMLTFYFAIMYSVSTLFAVLTRSTIVAILATLLAWFLFFAVGKINSGIENRLEREANPKQLLEDIVPKPGEPIEQPDPDEILSRIDPQSPLWGFIPRWSFGSFQVVHKVLPRTVQLDSLLSIVIAKGILSEPEMRSRGFNKPLSSSWIEILGVSTAFIVLMIGLSVWRFVTRDG